MRINNGSFILPLELLYFIIIIFQRHCFTTTFSYTNSYVIFKLTTNVTTSVYFIHGFHIKKHRKWNLTMKKKAVKWKSKINKKLYKVNNEKCLFLLFHISFIPFVLRGNCTANFFIIIITWDLWLTFYLYTNTKKKMKENRKKRKNETVFATIKLLDK